MSVKQLKKELLVVVRDLRKLSQKIDRMAKRVAKIEKSQKPKKTKTVELSEFPEIEPAILARVIRGKIYPRDIILGYIIASPDGIDMNTLQRKTGLKSNTIEQIIQRMRQEGKIRSKLKEGLRSPKNAGGMSRSLYFDSSSFLSITHEQSKKNGGQNFENNNGLF